MAADPPARESKLSAEQWLALLDLLGDAAPELPADLRDHVGEIRSWIETDQGVF